MLEKSQSADPGEIKTAVRILHAIKQGPFHYQKADQKYHAKDRSADPFPFP